jgi:hypothetical protein
MSLVSLLVWIREHKTSTAGLVFAVAACIGLVRLSHRVHHLHLKPAAAASGAAAASVDAGPGLAPSVTPSNQAGTEQTPRTARMRGEFENAASYLDFIQQAMSRPQEGGKFYALLAWRRCDELGQHPEIATTHTGDDAFHDGALALVQGFEKRCLGVSQAYPDIQTLYRVVTELRGGTDFLMPAHGRGIVAPSGRDTAGADIDAAIRTGDRWAEAKALRDNADFLDVGNPAGDDGVDRPLREWAAESVACELTGSCRGGIAVSLHCVSTGDCAHDDERDVVRARVPDAQQAVFDSMREGLHLRMGLTPAQAGTDS